MRESKEKQFMLGNDHSVFRENLKKLIEANLHYKVIAEASDSLELLDKLKRIECHILILDISMSNMNGWQVLDITAKKYPHMKTLILSGYREKEYSKLAYKKGAWGYLSKDDLFEKFDQALFSLINNKKYFDPDVFC